MAIKKMWFPQVRATAMMTGGIVGAGMLALPYVVSRSGLIVGLCEMVLVGITVVFIHLMITEIVLRTREHLELPGLAKKYLGPWGGWAMRLVFLFLGLSALTAFIIGSGEVLFDMTTRYNPIMWSVVFFGVVAVITILGTRGVSLFEIILACGVIAALLVMVGSSAPHIMIKHFEPPLHPDFFVGLGVMLFALGGSAIIPELEKILPGRGKKMQRAVIVGSLIPLCMYMVLVIAVLGVTGTATTRISTLGLGDALGPTILRVGSIAAILAMGSCFLVMATAMRRFFEWDLKLGSSSAVIAALGIPFLIFMAGGCDFVTTIGAAGALGSALEGILVVAMLWRSRTKGDVVIRDGMVYDAPIVTALILMILFAGIASFFLRTP